MRRLLVPLVAAALLGAPVVASASHVCPQAVKDVRGTNPSPATVAGYVATSAAARGVPPQVVKAVAFRESAWQPFNADGTPKLSNDSVCGIGLMQVTLGTRGDGVRLASDVAYNVDEGVKILRAKWDEIVAQHPSEPTGYPEDDPRVLENWYAALCRYNGCSAADADQAYALPVSRLIRDPFHEGVPSAIVAHMPPAGFTTPYDADPGYVFPGGFQAQADDEFHFFDSSTGTLTKVVPAPTHTDAPFPGYGTAYGPGGPNVSCGGCQWWRPAEGYGIAGWAHWTNSVTGTGSAGVQVTWTPPRTGQYDVAAFVPALPEPLARATYQLGTATRTVEQEAAKATWVPLGRHPLSATSPVRLGDGSDVSGVRIVADAMRFTAVTQLALSSSAATVTYGRSVTLTTRLSQVAGPGLPGRPVTLWKRKPGVLTWTRVGTYVTGTDGKVAVTATPATNTYYKATFAGDATAGAATDATRRVDVRPAVKAALSKTSLPRATAVKVSVSVAPSHAGQRVTLQRYYSGAWRNVVTATLGSTSAATFTVRWSTAGTYYYRVYKPADSDHVAGASARLTLKVT